MFSNCDGEMSLLFLNSVLAFCKSSISKPLNGAYTLQRTVLENRRSLNTFATQLLVILDITSTSAISVQDINNTGGFSKWNILEYSGKVKEIVKKKFLRSVHAHSMEYLPNLSSGRTEKVLFCKSWVCGVVYYFS